MPGSGVDIYSYLADVHVAVSRRNDIRTEWQFYSWQEVLLTCINATKIVQ